MQAFERKILEFIHKEKLLSSGRRVLVACSGGVDSVALLLFMATIREKLRIEVAAAHVDHMLRGQESADDGKLVKGLCEKLGIPFFGGNVPVPSILNEEGGNMQDVCRTGRYAFFTEVMQAGHYDVLATAHHAEDQLETVLMQMSKGNTPFGIPLSRKIDGGSIIRPFLPAMKEELLTYVKERGAQFREDPSNDSDAYLRNRLRRHVAPVIMSENPSAALNTVKMTVALQEDELLLGSLAKEHFASIVTFTEDGLPTFSLDLFSSMHTALQKRFIPLLLNYLYFGEIKPVEYNTALLNQLHHHLSASAGNVTIDLPRGYRFVREYGNVSIVEEMPIPDTSLRKLEKGEWTIWGDMLLYWGDADVMEADALETMYFDLPNADLPLYVRGRKDGDRLLLPGMTRPKRLSRLFIDEKIGAEQRRKIPVVTTANEEICAIPGVRYGIQFRERKTEQEKYIFKMKKRENLNGKERELDVAERY
ncbi:tRNA lysidine(34) synthetase TilS [Sporosarcina luteola]|uniref:tRNA lysidine(34) synthetase TilS n=1 Tax=Sporosarcina luteola TaxID=582850 RepID=UPI00203DD2AD|nr:tRNA lysidine(34) synthetase TilS [Sporosarcina luteola]MCM3712187.1 tRNA lysidine(34) synthetase TilS [Sporosarcina luteola]